MFHLVPMFFSSWMCGHRSYDNTEIEDDDDDWMNLMAFTTTKKLPVEVATAAIISTPDAALESLEQCKSTEDDSMSVTSHSSCSSIEQLLVVPFVSLHLYSSHRMKCLAADQGSTTTDDSDTESLINDDYWHTTLAKAMHDEVAEASQVMTAPTPLVASIPVSPAPPSRVLNVPVEIRIVCPEESSGTSSMIWDPTDRLVYYSDVCDDASSEMQHACDTLAQMLGKETPPDLDQFRQLLRKYPEVCLLRYPDMFPLHLACRWNSLPLVEECFQAAPEVIGCELLHSVVTTTTPDIVQFFTTQYPDWVKQTNSQHQTPLHVAVSMSSINVQIMTTLLQAYPTAAQLADANGWTPVHYLCHHGHVEALQALLQTSPTALRLTTQRLERPLHLAAQAGCWDMVQFLVYKDSSAVRATDGRFGVPLHYLAMHQTVDMGTLQLLVKVYPEAKLLQTEDDWTPYDLALKMNSDRAVLEALRTT